LPDAVNPGPEVKVWGTDGGGVAPGGLIPGEKCRLWRDLPDFGMNVYEASQGM